MVRSLALSHIAARSFHFNMPPEVLSSVSSHRAKAFRRVLIQGIFAGCAIAGATTNAELSTNRSPNRGRHRHPAVAGDDDGTGLLRL